MINVDKMNVKFQELRAQLYRPLLKMLTSAGVTADAVSNTRLVIGFFALVRFYFDPFQAAWIFIFALLLDTVDGALARYQDRASDRGKFLDVIVDHFITFLILWALFEMGADSGLVVINIFIVPVAYLLATIKKEEFEKSDWIIKPYPRLSLLKLPVLAFFAFIFFNVDFANLSLLVADIAAIIVSIYYFVFIQRRWKRAHSKQ